MAKLSLVANPTFKAPVEIPVAGGGSVSVEFTFKHRTSDALKAFFDDQSNEKSSDPSVIMDVACGWELEEPFDQENVAVLAQNYLAAPSAIFNTYIKELTGARRGN